MSKKKTLRNLHMNSINWRMPFNYAVIALITALSLGTVMMLVLTSYYNKLEKRYLQVNAISMQPIIESMIMNNYSAEQINNQFVIFSLLTQTQLKLIDQNDNVLADSGQIATMSKIMIQEGENGNSVVGVSIIKGDVTDATSGYLISRLESESLTDNEEDVILSINSAPMGGYLISTEVQPATNKVSSQTFLQPIMNGSLSLELSHGPAYGSDVLHSVTTAWSLAAIFSGIVAIISGILISKQVTHPVQNLDLAAQNMEQGYLSTRVDLDTNELDEFSNLANSFNAMANRIEKTVSTLRNFVSDAAHEINTPLTAIKLNLELAENESTVEKKEYYIQNAYQNCMRLERLSQSLLDLSRIESNSPNESKTTIQFVPFLCGISETFASQAEQKNIEFNIDMPEDPIAVNGNEQQLTQAISNLLENALKFTPETGTIALLLKQDTNMAIIQICDNGIGIPQEDIPHLFERFHRGRNTNQYPGNGLGLAIVKAIIDAHQGEVKAIPAEKGCCFQITMPIIS